MVVSVLTMVTASSIRCYGTVGRVDWSRGHCVSKLYKWTQEQRYLSGAPLVVLDSAQSHYLTGMTSPLTRSQRCAPFVAVKLLRVRHWWYWCATAYVMGER